MLRLWLSLATQGSKTPLKFQEKIEKPFKSSGNIYQFQKIILRQLNQINSKN